MRIIGKCIDLKKKSYRAGPTKKPNIWLLPADKREFDDHPQ